MSVQKTASVVHVIDDDDAYREAIVRVLDAGGYEARTYANAGDYLLSHVPAGSPSCILMDLHMPGPDGFALQAALRARGDSQPIIFISAETKIPAAVKAIKSGADDFLTKPVEAKVLFAAIKAALARDAQERPAIEQARVWRARYEALTPKEIAVLDRLVAGRMNKEIAKELGAAERTVKAHRAQIMAKMGARSLAELVHIMDELQIDPAH